MTSFFIEFDFSVSSRYRLRVSDAKLSGNTLKNNKVRPGGEAVKDLGFEGTIKAWPF